MERGTSGLIVLVQCSRRGGEGAVRQEAFRRGLNRFPTWHLLLVGISKEPGSWTANKERKAKMIKVGEAQTPFIVAQPRLSQRGVSEPSFRYGSRMPKSPGPLGL